MSRKQVDFRTPLQRERDKRNERIFKDYKDLLENISENTTKWAIWRVLGERYGLKAQGIRAVITKMESHVTEINYEKEPTTQRVGESL